MTLWNQTHLFKTGHPFFFLYLGSRTREGFQELGKSEEEDTIILHPLCHWYSVGENDHVIVLPPQGILTLGVIIYIHGTDRGHWEFCLYRDRRLIKQSGVCQTASSANVDRSERSLPIWTHSYSYHGQFFSKVPWDTFLSFRFSSITKISLVSYQHDRNAVMGCVLPWRKERNCAYVKHWTSYEVADDNSYPFWMPLICHMLYRQYL